MRNVSPLKLWVAALGLALSATALADTVTLKSGETIQGKIIQETDKEITIAVSLSASITDDRTVAKSDVAKVEKETADSQAYAAIKNLKPGPNSLPAASYEQIIKSLENFVTQNVQSPNAGDVQQQLAAWQEEKKRVDAGEVKLNDRWLSKEEAQKERYQINGHVVLNHMQQQFRQGDLTGALNSFDQLERSYPGARVYPDAVETAKQILPALKANVERALESWKHEKAEREKGIQLLSEPQKSQTIALQQREQQQANATAQAASRGNLKWPPFIPRHEASLNAIKGKIPEELRRLGALPVAKFRQSLQLADKARTELGKGEFDQATATLRQASEQWQQNEILVRLQAELSEKRTAAAAASAAAQRAAAAATPTPVPSTPRAEVETAAQVAPAPAEEEPSFFTTPFGIAVTVILGILVVGAYIAFRKVKGRANEVLE